MFDNQYAVSGRSKWDNDTHIMPFDSTQIASAQSNQYLITLPRNTSQIPVQILDSRQSRPVIAEIKPTSTVQTTQPNTIIGQKSKACTPRITTSQFVGLLLGIVLTGIPLAVIVTLYLLLPAINNNVITTMPTTYATNAPVLPNQCSSYGTINDGTRIVSSSACCYADCSNYNGWHRIIGASGSQLVTYPVSNGGWCGTNLPGWFNSSLPSGAGKTTLGSLCVNAGGNLCHPSYSINNILATNCSGFYVFYLYSLSCSCCTYPRYCTI